MIYPLLLSFIIRLKISCSIILTVLFILACIVFICSLNKMISNKLVLIYIFTFLLFNPITYSSDTFQRLYRNSLSITEMLFFLGLIIRIISMHENKIINYIFLGLITSILYLTREDNIWVIIVLIIMSLCSIYEVLKLKKNSWKMLFLNVIPFGILIICLNSVSFINFKNYNIYTYNELFKTHFKDAYKRILQIKDDEKLDNIAIPKSTLLRLSEISKTFNFSENEIEINYRALSKGETQLHNGKMIWFLRRWIQKKNNFKDGKEADDYYFNLSKEIDELFSKGILEKEIVFPSVYMYMPTMHEIKKLPYNFIEAIKYTSSYKNIKTFSKTDLEKNFKYNNDIGAYYIVYSDYHNAENIIDNNPIGIEIIRNIYKYFTIVFSIVALIIYIKNIKIKDKLNLIIHIIFLIYIIIICGVTYTHTTAFCAIRYCYLSNIYILQNLFILLNLYRAYSKHKGINIK